MYVFEVTGMNCAACSERVHKAVIKVEGVEDCVVNLLTNSMTVSGDASPETVICAVINAGYNAALKDGRDLYKNDSEYNIFKEIRARLIKSGVGLIFLMFFGMGPDFAFLSDFYRGIIEAVLSFIIIIINRKFFISGFKAVLHLAPNMDTLVSMGAGVSFIYSLYAFFFGDGVLYFESAGMILTLICVGKMLEAFSKGKTTDAIKSLMNLAKKTVNVVDENNNITVVPADKVSVGDIYIVRAGEGIPMDGEIISGEAIVNESMFSGESVPVYKSKNDRVFAGTINCEGVFTAAVTKKSSESVLSEIIKTVSVAGATKPPISKAADRIAGIFVPVVLLISIITFICWMIISSDLSFSLERAICVLVISCPCSLGLATPVAIMVGSGVGAKHGILFKNAECIEALARTKKIIFDKTGTLTKGELTVSDVIEKTVSKKELCDIAYALELNSNHPYARAIVSSFINSKYTVCDFKEKIGMGVFGRIPELNKTVYGGNAELLKGVYDLSPKEKELIENAEKEGKTAIVFFCDDCLYGIVTLSDIIKNDANESIEALKALSIKTTMLTGDNELTANAIGRKLRIDEIIAGCKPNDKADIAKGLVFVGDGINDAPALSAAAVGISLKTGTDVAIDASDIVLLSPGVKGVVNVVKLSRAILKNIYENLFWAFFYNVICIPLAAGVFSNLAGFNINPMIGAGAMGLSSFFVVMNALRLNLFKCTGNADSLKKDTDNTDSYGKDKDEDNIGKRKEDVRMEISISIEGMMCPRCEAHVVKALSEIEGVCEVTASHIDKKAYLSLNKNVADEELKAAVTEAGYEFVRVNR